MGARALFVDYDTKLLAEIKARFPESETLTGDITTFNRKADAVVCYKPKRDYPRKKFGGGKLYRTCFPEFVRNIFENVADVFILLTIEDEEENRREENRIREAGFRQIFVLEYDARVYSQKAKVRKCFVCRV